MATNVKELNNIVYVEPNLEYQAGSQFGVNGLETFESVPPTEDYCIYVNLEVEVKGRRINASNPDSDSKMVLSWESTSDKTTMNFMQGTKMPGGTNYFTTNYTDIYLKDIKRNGPSTEMFGIKSIDISYTENMQPIVTIEFVDIRGVALFAQREYYETAIHSTDSALGESEENVANSFFQCFFTFPYPKFTLMVKGFYGNPVSYDLACTDYRAKFDSKTGNFNCTAKFIGYYFAFLNDVMLNALVSAPYSDYVGGDYWAAKDFKLKTLDGTQTTMPKLAQLSNILKKVEAEVKKLSESTPEVQKKNALDEKNKSLNELRSQYSNYINVTRIGFKRWINEENKVEFVVSSDGKNGDWKNCVIFTESDNDKSFEEYSNKGNINETYKLLKETIERYNSENTNAIPIPSNIATLYPSKRIVSKGNDGKYIVNDSGNDDIKNNDPKLYEKFVTNVSNANRSKISDLKDFTSIYYYTDNGFTDTVEKELADNDKETKKADEQINAMTERYITDSLGWKPSIENITRIVMAHFETFAYMLYKCGIDIVNEKRTVSSLGVSSSDLSDVDTARTNEIVPPFPKVTEIVEKDGSKRREETWVGRFSGYFKEKDLVHGIINGISEVAKILSVTDADNVGQITDSPMSSSVKSPLTVYDLLSTTKAYDSSGFDVNDVSSLLGIVALRAMGILNLTSFNKNSSYSITNDAKQVGIAEAANMLDTVNISRDMKDKLYGLKNNPDAIIEMLKGNESEYIKKPNGGAGPWPWRTSDDTGAIGLIDSNGTMLICKDRTSSKDSYMMPINNLSWTNINRDTVNGGGSGGCNRAHTSDNYVDTVGTKVGEHYKNNLFQIELNISRISKIIDSQITANGLEDFRQKLKDQAFYNKDTYGKYLQNGDKLVVYTIANASKLNPKEYSALLPLSSSLFKKGVKYIGGGFDVDHLRESEISEWTYTDGSKVKRNGSDGFTKYLDVLNSYDFNFIEFPSVTEKLYPHIDHSIFGDMLYYRQHDILSKAYLFLCGLGHFIKYEKVAEDIVSSDDQIFNIPFPSILFFGGAIWAHKNKSSLNGIKEDNFGEKLYNNKLQYLRGDVKSNFETMFMQWVEGGMDWVDNSVIKPFYAYADMLELKMKRDDMSVLDFLGRCGEWEDYALIDSSLTDRSWFKEEIYSKSGRNYKTLSDMLAGELSDNFFENYIAIDEDAKNHGMRLGNRDGGPGVVAACRFVLAGCTFIKLTRFLGNSDKGIDSKITVNTSILKNFFDGFLEKVLDGFVSQSEIESSAAKEAAEPENSNDDIKIGVYRYCKLLYDKWIGGLSETQFKNEYTVERFFDDADNYFVFIDTYYNKANDVFVNIEDFSEKVKSCFNPASEGQYSLLSFLSDIYAHNKFYFTCVNNFLDLAKTENIKNLFDLVPLTRMGKIKSHQTFVALYYNEPSSHLDIPNSDYPDDSFLLNQWNDQTKWPESLKSKALGVYEGYPLPAFGVTFGKMYQSFFTDYDVDMSNPMVTEQSIKAQFAIISQQNEEDNSGDKSNLVYYGQDLYSVYSNNSYTCTVTMMGCAFIQPLMYFVLNNIPMFRGTYIIKKVQHNITPGNMITKFVGVRLSNVATRQAENYLMRKSINENGNGGNNDSTEQLNIENKLANIDNNCPYKVYPLIEGGGAGGGIPQDFLNMSWGALKSECPGWIQKQRPPSAWLKDKNDITVKQVLVASIASEYIGYTHNDSLMLKVSAAILCNRYHYCSKLSGPNKWIYLIGTAQAGTGNPKATEKAYNDYKDIVEPILVNGPQMLVGLVAAPQSGNNVEIWNRSTTEHKKASNTHVITSDDMQRVFSYCTQGGYDYEHLVAERKKNGGTPVKQGAYENKSVPNNGESTWKKADFLFQEYNTVFVSNPDNPGKKYWEVNTSAKLSDNEDKHVDSIVEAFVNALNNTCESSSVGIRIGFDSKKSKKNVAWITNGNNSSNFGALLDVMLQAYGDKLDEIKWVLNSENNINAEPVAFICTVNKQSTKDTIVMIVSETDITKGLDATVGEGALNNKFSMAVVKKYTTYSDGISTYIKLRNEEIKKMFDENKVEECDKVMKDAGYDNNSDSMLDDSVGGPIGGKIDNWDIGKSATWAKRHCYPSYDKNNCGICSFSVQQIIIAGGIEIGHGNGYRCVTSTVQNTNYWKLIAKGRINDENYKNYKPQLGDVMGMTKGELVDVYGHVCIWCGDAWYSDFKQNGPYVYGSAKNPKTNQKLKDGQFWVMRYMGGGPSTKLKPSIRKGDKHLRA